MAFLGPPCDIPGTHFDVPGSSGGQGLAHRGGAGEAYLPHIHVGCQLMTYKAVGC